MTMSVFGNRGFQSRAANQPLPKDATLRDFGNGLNLVDSDTALQTNWSKVLKNMHRDVDGGMSLRWGTKFKFDVSDVVSGDIIEIVDFSGELVCFMDSGEIAAVNLTTGAVAIWNDAIANALVGAPDGWGSGITQIDFTDFKNQLIVCNGLDKPIIIDNDLSVDYLQDIPTGSNVYTPIGKYCTTVGDYVVIAGIDSAKDEIYVSAKGASGTWPGDADPNDAVSFNVATYAPQVNSNIRGLSSFRNFLLVHFAGLTVPIQLGTYDTDGNHTPIVSDVIPDYGIMSHRMSVVLAQEIVFADERGVYSAKRNLFGQALEGAHLSQKITPGYATLPVVATEDGFDTQLTTYSVYNRLEGRIMFFIKTDAGTKGFIFSFVEGLKKPAWSVVEGMNFSCGCHAATNRVYFAEGTKIFQYGNGVFEDENYTADLIDDNGGAWVTATGYVVGDRRSFGGTTYSCLTAHTSSTSFSADLAAGLWEEYFGTEIAFDWELPWSDANARATKKKLTTVHFDTEGTATFSFQAFVDKLYRNKLTQALTPALDMNFVGGDSDGYGGSGSQPYGGGRRTADERMWGYPVEFKLLKLRLHGSTRYRLKVETITLLFIKGKLHR